MSDEREWLSALAARNDMIALVDLMRPAMGDDCTLDELRAYATRILASDWLAAHDAATRAEAHEQGYMDGYENGLLDPGSAWMKVRESDLAAARADERALVLDEVERRIGEQRFFSLTDAVIAVQVVSDMRAEDLSG